MLTLIVYILRTKIFDITSRMFTTCESCVPSLFDCNITFMIVDVDIISFLRYLLLKSS